MRFPRIPLLVLSLASTLAVIAYSPALAADAGTAVAQLKTSHAGATKTLKAALKTAREAFLTELKAFEAAVKDGAGDVTLTQGLFDDLIALQLATGAAIKEAFVQTALAANQALATLPQPLNGIYPRGFTVGDGGLADQFRVQADGAIQKHVASLRKRLVKTTALADKAGIGLTFRVEVPVVVSEYQWSESTTASGGGAAPAVDTIVAFSALDVLGDGRFFVGGRASSNSTVTIEFFGQNQFEIGGVPVTSQRWATTVDTAEGNYIINVGQPGDAVTFPPITIGAR